MKELKVISLYFFLIVNLFSGLHLEAKSIVSGDIVEGQAYQPNFLKQKGHYEKNANGTSAYADAAGTRPVDGSGGAPTLSCTRTTSSPIDGDGSLLITKDAANRQGQGCTIQFTIDSAYKAKVLQIEFDYMVASGTFTAGSSSADSDLIVYIYDVTNSTLIEPSSIKLLSNSSTISDHFVANFQTSATGTTYNLILHQATTSASAYTVKADNFEVKPSKYIYGTPISDWVSYTPTGSWSTNTTYTGRWRRVGDNLESNVNVLVSGAPTSATLTVNLPTGLSIDTAKLPSILNAVLGKADILDSGTQQYPGDVLYSSTTAVLIASINAGSTYGLYNNVTQAVPITFGASDAVQFTYSVPITGWSSSTQVSDGYDGRQIVLSRFNQTTQSINNTVTSIVDFPVASIDTTNSWRASSGAFNSAAGTFATTNPGFVVPSSGEYRVSAGVRFQGTVSPAANSNLLVSVYLDGTLAVDALGSWQNGGSAGTNIGPGASGSATIRARAGQVIDIRIVHSFGAAAVLDNNSRTYLSIEKLSSPQTMSATEVVSFDVNTSTTAGSTSTPLLFTVINDNSHGAYSSSTGKFTAPYPGTYHFSVGAYFGSTSASIRLYKNGTYIRQGSQSSLTSVSVLSTELKLIAGDTVEVRPDASATANGSPEINFFSGFKIK